MSDMYKVWDKDVKEMYYLTENTTKNNSIIDMKIVFDEWGTTVLIRKYGESIYKRVRNFELLRWTGLVDKNGVRIYQGDILKAELLPISAWAHVVEWDEANARWNTWGDKRESAAEWASRHEVVGNIYEHSDLLGEVK